MGSQIQLTMSLIFIALFSLAIFGFAIQFAADNNVPTNLTITSDPTIQDFVNEDKEKLDIYKTDSEGTYASIIDTTVEPGSDVAQSTGPFTVSVSNVISVVKSIIFVPYRVIFGSGEGFTIFFTIFGSVIVLLFGLFVYKTLRGNPG